MSTNKLVYNYSIAAQSRCGKRHENQDNYLVINGDGSSEFLHDEQVMHQQKNDWPCGHVRLLVADGMGGHQHGKEAAAALVEAFYTTSFQRNLQQLHNRLSKIHQNLFALYRQGTQTPGSTLVMADINPYGQAIIANIGDSRAYLYHDQTWQQLTRDHTIEEYAWRDQEISREAYQKALFTPTCRIAQAMIYGSSGILPNKAGNKSFQHQPRLRIDKQDLFHVSLTPGDRLMLVSDGLWSQSSDNQYSIPRPNPEQLLPDFITEQQQQAIKEGSMDNLTSIILTL